MPITIALPPDTEKRLREEAARRGIEPDGLIAALLEREFRPAVPTARELLGLDPAESEAILARAAEDAAPLYEEDLARAAAERELTAFTALDGEGFLGESD